MDIIDHFVDFDKYCKFCKHAEVNDKKGGEPCNECLNEPINQNSRKPVYYKEDPEKIAKAEKEEKEKEKKEE